MSITKFPTTLLLMLLLALLGILFMAAGRQVTLPITGIESNRHVMPPDPDQRCKKVDLNRLDNEIARAELAMQDGTLARLVDWKYLQRALDISGVFVSGPQDEYWLRTIKGLYARCHK